MARKPTTAVAYEIVAPLATGNLADKATALSADAQRSMEIAERFGDGVPYERERIVSETRFFMAASAEAMFEVGKRLIQIKENEPHGEFTEIVTQRLGISMPTARRSMQAAVKFLAPKRSALSVLGKAKLFDLMVESDDDLDALAEGGTVAGLKLTDMQCMTSRELKAALVESRSKEKKAQAKYERTSKLNDELRQALERKRQKSILEVKDSIQLDRLRSTFLKVDAAIYECVSEVDVLIESGVSETVRTAARQTVDLIVQRVVDHCLARGIAVDLADRVRPVYMEPIDQTVAAGAESRRLGKARG